MLSWRWPDPDQETAIAAWSERGDLSELFDGLLHTGRKDLWRNAARVLHRKSDEDVARISSVLLEWYMDANWPGFVEIDQRLTSMPVSLFATELDAARIRAAADGDNEWMEWLSTSFPVSDCT